MLDLSRAGVRRLRPDTTRIFADERGLLHADVDGVTHSGIFAVRLFPIRHPDHFISLAYTDSDDKVREIGVIEDLEAFPDESVRQIRQTLSKHYYEQQVERVFAIKLENGLLFFDAQTHRGREKFIVPWRHDRAEEYDEHGKVLLDALDNRYIIPDLRQLPERDRLELTRFIYW